jgi:hypothetical protein
MSERERCPHCGQVMPRSRITADDLRRWCLNNGYLVLPDGAVRESAAAAILGRAAGTLRNWRNGAGTVPLYRHRGRVTYRLHDLAEHLESGRTDEI